jgi:hypothetical protein
MAAEARSAMYADASTTMRARSSATSTPGPRLRGPVLDFMVDFIMDFVAIGRATLSRAPRSCLGPSAVLVRLSAWARSKS